MTTITTTTPRVGDTLPPIALPARPVPSDYATAVASDCSYLCGLAGDIAVNICPCGSNFLQERPERRNLGFLSVAVDVNPDRARP